MTEPFAMVPEWLLLSGASPSAVKLFAVLHRHDGPGGIFPSRARLASLMGCSVRTVDRLTHQLEELGALTVTPRFAPEGDRASNSYRLRFAEVATPVSLRGDTTVARGGDTGVARGGDTSVALTRPPLNENPLNESVHTQLRFDEVAALRAHELAGARANYEREGEEWPGDDAYRRRKRWAVHTG